MSRIIRSADDENFELIVQGADRDPSRLRCRSPVHVVYGGAHLFKSDTPKKLGRIALNTLGAYAAASPKFAAAVGLDPETASEFAETIYRRTIQKLQTEPVEDFRIDFEDGYGFRPDEEEDSHAASAAKELAASFDEGTITAFSGIRIKSLAVETRERSVRTLRIFLETFLARTTGKLPADFVVTLPKITCPDEVKRLVDLLEEIEETDGLADGSIGIEIMIETPQAVIDHKGRFAPSRLVRAAGGRCRSVHFGAYDYTSLLGISASRQGIDHDACNFARQAMLVSLAPLGIRLSDSVTTQLPVPPNRGDSLSEDQISQNSEVVHAAWRKHFENVTRSMANGFYQSWDLHPNQLPTRFAAVYAFFLESFEIQGRRLRGFIEKASQANLTGSVFDDAASARGLINFFRQGVDCGALTADEVEKAGGLTLGELRRGSFSEIIENRRK